MERFAGGRNVMLATGGAAEPPSRRNPALRWIFSTSLTAHELAACEIERDAPRPTLRLITVGRQEAGKGTLTLIESLPLILEEFPGASLDVVGDGSVLPRLRDRAAALQVADRVTFHGQIDHAEVIRLLQQADLFCFPTASEGFPKVVLEALACGLPVVTSPVSVLPLLIGNGCGCLIEEPSPAAIAGAVRKCLEDPERYRAMSARAVETARQYSLERWRETIGDLLEASWKVPLTSCPISRA
jgi:glycosyltransferase involved in cell wall biosynthesis